MSEEQEFIDETFKILELFDAEMERLQLLIKIDSQGPPKQKTIIALGETTPNTIMFWASETLAEGFNAFGTVFPASFTSKNQWRLLVDRRFNFEEVVNYIRNLEAGFNVS